MARSKRHRIRISAVKPVEAIEWARRREVELPADYYGKRIAQARALAFSIAGMTKLDQIEHVRDSLNRVLEEGGTFQSWQEEMLKAPEALALPRHRLDNIFRTNLQSAYMAGRCRAIQAHKDTRPYLLYSAVNDSRTRPSHAAMDGTVLPVDDPWWEAHMPPNGFRCRCTVISLTEEQARRRGISSGPPPGGRPDDGWDYSVCSHGQEEGVRRAVTRRESQCGDGAAFADRKASILEDPIWCRNKRMRRALDRIQETLDKWDDPERLVREALGVRAWRKHADAVPKVLPGAMTQAHGVILRAYTDRDLDAWPLMNSLARSIPHPGPLPFDDEELLYRAGILVYMMDEAISMLPPERGVFHRGVEPDKLGNIRKRFLQAHTRRGRILKWAGFSSVRRQRPYAYPIRFRITISQARDIQQFSVAGEPELILPRDTQIRVVDYTVEDDLYLIEAEEYLDESKISGKNTFSVA